ncbi:MAG: hypothetical protein DDT19_00216 [Syntrophomonadaceae bacterium]|nr:hypothetical protein [Bacillota bacterium]
MTLKSDKEINPFAWVVPQDYQKSFMTSQKWIRMILGGNFSGKSFISLLDLVLCLTGNNHYQPNFPKPPIQARLVCNSFKIADEVIYPTLRQLLPDYWISETKKNQQGAVDKIYLTNKSFLSIMSNVQDDNLFEAWKGHYLLFDEPPKRAALIGSIRGLYDMNCKCVFNFTPIEDTDKLKVNYDDLAYLYDEFFMKARENGGESDNIATFTWPRWRNRYISQEMTKEFAKHLREEEREARVEGRWQFLTGLIFTDFNKETQVIDEFDLPNDKYSKYIAIDPHSVSPTGVLFLAIDRDNNFIVFDELYEPNMIIDNLCMNIKKRAEGHIILKKVIDPQASERNQLTNSTYISEFIKRLGFIIPAKRDRREVGITKIKQLTKDNRLFVFRRCPNFIKEMSKFRNLSDDADHLIDSLRNLLSINIYYHDPEKIREQQKKGYDPLYR